MNKTEDKELLTKDHILNEAIKLFSIQGYDGLRMDNLAKIAKINKATIYYYFQNKQTLYEMIIMKVAKSFYEKLQKNLEDKIDDQSKLETFIDTALYFVQNNRDVAKIMMIELSYEWKNITPEIKENFIPIILVLKDILQKGEENNIFHKINPLLLQGIIMGGFNYYLLMKNIYENFPSTNKAYIEFTDGKEEIKNIILKSIIKGY